MTAQVLTGTKEIEIFILQVLPLQGPVSFSYEYYVPHELGNAIPQTTYKWLVKSKGKCSASCAGGDEWFLLSVILKNQYDNKLGIGWKSCISD